jgi:hypothetical protein
MRSRQSNPEEMFEGKTGMYVNGSPEKTASYEWPFLCPCGINSAFS